MASVGGRCAVNASICTRSKRQSVSDGSPVAFNANHIDSTLWLITAFSEGLPPGLWSRRIRRLRRALSCSLPSSGCLPMAVSLPLTPDRSSSALITLSCIRANRPLVVCRFWVHGSVLRAIQRSPNPAVGHKVNGGEPRRDLWFSEALAKAHWLRASNAARAEDVEVEGSSPMMLMPVASRVTSSSCADGLN